MMISKLLILLCNTSGVNIGTKVKKGLNDSMNLYNFSRQKPNDKSIRVIAGFTLVELLVVISIIALLLAILMPSLQSAREQAVKVVCASNMRQTSLAMRMYNNDNKSYYPPDYQPNAIGYTNPWEYVVWQQYLVPYASKTGNCFTCSNFKKSFKATVAKPLDSTNNFYNWYTPSGVASFGFNHLALSCSGNNSGWECASSDKSITVRVKTEQVKRPSQLIMIVDFGSFVSFGNKWSKSYMSAYPDWYRNPTVGLFLGKYRHKDGANILFADNHYEWAPIKSTYFDYYVPSRNPYWFNDYIGWTRK